jgi:cytochrome c oxidase assembly factor CtaG
MVQHIVLLEIVPALLVIGSPWERWGLRIPSHPLAAFVVFNANMWLWHVPKLFDLTSISLPVHAAEHLSFVVLGVWFWSLVLGPTAVNSAVERMALLVGASASAWLLAIWLAFAPRPLYGAYLHVPGAVMSPLTDQQLAGGFMWVPGSVPLALALLASFLAWTDDSRPTSVEGRNTMALEGR